MVCLKIFKASDIWSLLDVCVGFICVLELEGAGTKGNFQRKLTRLKGSAPHIFKFWGGGVWDLLY